MTHSTWCVMEFKPSDIPALVTLLGGAAATAASIASLWKTFKTGDAEKKTAIRAENDSISNAEARLRKDLLDRLSRIEEENERLRNAQDDLIESFEDEKQQLLIAQATLAERIAGYTQRITALLMEREVLLSENEKLRKTKEIRAGQ